MRIGNVTGLPHSKVEVGDARLGGFPFKFIGTWNPGVTYQFGDVVRWPDEDEGWYLYVCIKDDNLNHDPELNDSSGGWWLDTEDSEEPIVVWGNVNPISFGEQNRITHYTQDGTGGTFDLGTATGIAFGAVEGDIQTALDTEYGIGKTVVTGGAHDFTVEYYLDENPLVADYTNLTGDTFGTQVETQALIVGGFKANPGCICIDVDNATVWLFDADDGIWTVLQGNQANISLAASFNLKGNKKLQREGTGDGDSQLNAIISREDKGNGNATGSLTVSRSGSGAGDATADISVSIEDSAVGEASAITTASNWDSDSAQIGVKADPTDAYIQLGKPLGDGLAMAARPSVVTATNEGTAVTAVNQIRDALIAAGLLLDGD